MKVGVFNTAFVGDVALMGQLMDALSIAGHEVILFSNAAGCSLYQFDPRIKKTVKVKKKKGFGKFVSVPEISRQIRDSELDVLLLAHASFTTGLIASLSGVKKIFSFDDSSFSHVFFEKIERPDSCHESRRYLELCRKIVDAPSFEEAKISLSGDTTLTHFSQAFPDFLCSAEAKFFICSPGSVWQSKRYPPSHMARVLARLLAAQPHLNCVLSGGPQDRSVLSELLSNLETLCPAYLSSGRVINALECLPLAELIELTRKASFVLTPDSAPLHIASATGTRTFALFGPTSAQTGFGPLACGSHVIDHSLIAGSQLACQPCSKHGHHACPKRHHQCLAGLPPNAVADYLLQCLSV